MSGNFVVPPVNEVYTAQYYKSANQNLLNGATDITFDRQALWNNTGGYVTHTSGSTNFTVRRTGLYQLEFNASIFGAPWSDELKQLSIDISRSPFPEQVTIVQNASIPSSRNYGQGICANFYLFNNDIINCRVVNTFSSGTPFVLGSNSNFDLNTWFTWKFIN
jgi:hypothetical protein